MVEAEIYVTLKEMVSDPQGLIIRQALSSLNYREVEEVRMGKLITIKLNIADRREAERRIDQMCQRLLANPVVEEYSFKIREI